MWSGAHRACILSIFSSQEARSSHPPASSRETLSRLMFHRRMATASLSLAPAACRLPIADCRNEGRRSKRHPFASRRAARSDSRVVWSTRLEKVPTMRIEKELKSIRNIYKSSAHGTRTKSPGPYLAITLLAIVINNTTNTLALSYQDMSSSGQQNDIKTLSTACNKFTIPLYKSLSTNIDSNVVISPLSLYIILSLLSNGAGGFTLTELKSVLHHDDTASLNDEFKSLALLLNDPENIELHIANKIYVQNGFDLMAEFLAICRNIFQSLFSRLDFNDNGLAVKTINSWVQKATNNKIFDIISSDDIDQDTRIMLINAIYFKSKWLHMFDESYTVKRKFHVSKTETNLVPTMFKRSKYAYGEIPIWHTSFIEIPYLNQDFVMIILLPDREIELQVLENNFNWETLADAPRSTDEVALYLPKFKFEITIDLKDALRKIGLNTMFEDNADFTRLSNIPLKVSHALQKIFIEINEEGSEAAAATVVGMRLKRMAILPMEFVVDRPFLFAIEHKPSKVLLFLGSVRKIESVQERDEL